VHPLGGEQVLLDLVRDHAEPGFLDREAGQRLGLGRDGRGHRVDDRVNLGLGVLREDGLGGPRATHECPGLGDGGEIRVGLSGGGGHRPA
jgi:hypothetical protein